MSDYLGTYRSLDFCLYSFGLFMFTLREGGTNWSISDISYHDGICKLVGGT